MADEGETEEVNKRIRAKEDLVRKLKMVKLHRTKHNSAELDKLINEWLRASQEALDDLLEKLQESSSDPKEISMPVLLKHMNIEPESVGYSIEDETFIS